MGSLTAGALPGGRIRTPGTRSACGRDLACSLGYGFPMSEEKPKYPPSTEQQLRIAKPIMKIMGALNTWIYRATGGRWTRTFFGSGEVGILVVRGRKSGRMLDIPLVFARDGENIVVIASQGGMPKHPIWYLNLRANPDVEFEIGADRRAYRAEVVEEAAERTRLWQIAQASYPDFDEYQKRTERIIPVIRLVPRDAAAQTPA